MFCVSNIDINTIKPTSAPVIEDSLTPTDLYTTNNPGKLLLIFILSYLLIK